MCVCVNICHSNTGFSSLGPAMHLEALGLVTEEVWEQGNAGECFGWRNLHGKSWGIHKNDGKQMRLEDGPLFVWITLRILSLSI